MLDAARDSRRLSSLTAAATALLSLEHQTVLSVGTQTCTEYVVVRKLNKAIHATQCSMMFNASPLFLWSTTYNDVDGWTCAQHESDKLQMNGVANQGCIRGADCG